MCIIAPRMNLQLSETHHCFWISLETLRGPVKRWTLGLPTIQDERVGSLEGEITELPGEQEDSRKVEKAGHFRRNSLALQTLNFP